jgi:hypothetical protein
MNKSKVRSIIETTLTSGTKTPGLFDLPKILSLKSKLESCTSISEVIGILEGSRSFLSKSFGLSDAVFDAGVEKLEALAKS